MPRKPSVLSMNPLQSKASREDDFGTTDMHALWTILPGRSTFLTTVE